jgi:hypothetical protein
VEETSGEQETVRAVSQGVSGFRLAVRPIGHQCGALSRLSEGRQTGYRASPYIKAALEELLGGDEDGLASTFEEHGL